MNNIVKNTLILTVITLVSGLLLGAVYQVTKDPIEARAEQTKQEAYSAVLSEAKSFEELSLPEGTGDEMNTVTALIKGTRDDGSDAGYVVLVTSHMGYGGDISMAVGVDEEGTVKGLEILDLSETPGLGMRSTEEEFRSRFVGLDSSAFTVNQGENAYTSKVDAISGATITTKAVMGAVYTAIAQVEG